MFKKIVAIFSIVLPMFASSSWWIDFGASWVPVTVSGFSSSEEFDLSGTTTYGGSVSSTKIYDMTDMNEQTYTIFNVFTFGYDLYGFFVDGNMGLNSGGGSIGYHTSFDLGQRVSVGGEIRAGMISMSISSNRYSFYNVSFSPEVITSYQEAKGFIFFDFSEKKKEDPQNNIVKKTNSKSGIVLEVGYTKFDDDKPNLSVNGKYKASAWYKGDSVIKVEGGFKMGVYYRFQRNFL